MHEADIDKSDEGKVYVTFTDVEFRKWVRRYPEQERLFTCLGDGRWLADAEECLRRHQQHSNKA